MALEDKERLSSKEIDKLPEIDKHMIATTGIHMLGDISRDEGDLCRVSHESETDYYGMWITGMGYFNVRFPKKSTRELTEEEIEKYNKMYVQLASNPPMKLKVD